MDLLTGVEALGGQNISAFEWPYATVCSAFKFNAYFSSVLFYNENEQMMEMRRMKRGVIMRFSGPREVLTKNRLGE